MSNGDTLNVAMCSTDCDNIIVYFSSATSIDFDMSKITRFALFSAIWIDPQTGKKHQIGSFKNVEPKTFSTPEGWEDALLLIEAINR